MEGDTVLWVKERDPWGGGPARAGALPHPHTPTLGAGQTTPPARGFRRRVRCGRRGKGPAAMKPAQMWRVRRPLIRVSLKYVLLVEGRRAGNGAPAYRRVARVRHTPELVTLL